MGRIARVNKKIGPFILNRFKALYFPAGFQYRSRTMYCPQCGTQNSDRSRYCLSCGTSFVAEATALPTPASPPPPPPFAAAERAPLPQVRYAGFWLRFVAWVLDLIALAMVRMAMSQIHSPFFVFGGTFVITWIYFAAFESSTLQATPGKMALSLYVTDLEGRRIGFGRASGRFFGKILSSILLGIGYVVAGFSQRKQALHDMMAGCLVRRR